MPCEVARPCADLIPTLRPGGGKAYIRGPFKSTCTGRRARAHVPACVRACVRLLRLAAASHGAHIIRWRYRSPNDVRPMWRRPSHIGAPSAIKSATTTLATIQHHRRAMAPLFAGRGRVQQRSRPHVRQREEGRKKSTRARVGARAAMYPLYQDASKVLELMEQRKGTANRLSLNASIRNKKACLALAAETSRSAWRAFSAGDR